MEMPQKPLRAIDLYSGIGGWALGLRMAGIETVASYEWWQPANITNKKNNRHDVVEADIRNFPLDALPKNIDIVVGSPPCTEFSFSNRGGSGNMKEGIKDVYRFLEIVEYVKPKFWVMENVPRTAGIIEGLMKKGRELYRFSHLSPAIRVLNISEFGLPQNRRRCLVGNINFDLLDDYSAHCPKRTLGDVVNGLAKKTVNDPLYEFQLKGRPSEIQKEAYLVWEEERMNREAKTYHPVYNNMEFPDRFDRPARTVTATCTRVSRESIVIEERRKRGSFRRLSIRERASLQGFPISFEFFGGSHAQKLKLIGNAFPPIMSFYIGQTILGTRVARLKKPSAAIKRFPPLSEFPRITQPDSESNSFQSNRRFRAAIPGLRFKSGVRFELSNVPTEGQADWRVAFFFGNSKSIHEISLDFSLLKFIENLKQFKRSQHAISLELRKLKNATSSVSAGSLQAVWTRKVEDGVHPYSVVDALGQTGEVIFASLDELDSLTMLDAILHRNFKSSVSQLQGVAKIKKYSRQVLSGIIVGSFMNRHLIAHVGQLAA